MDEILGGSYYEVKKSNRGKGYESHHVLSFSSYREELKNLDHKSGPAIRMTKKDHIQTRSYDNTKESKKFALEQRQLLKEGKIGQAWKREVSDIRGKFGSKYDQHIKQSEKHMLKLHKEGKIKLDDKFKEKLEQRQKSYTKEPTQPAKKEVFSRNSSPFEQKKDTGKSR